MSGLSRRGDALAKRVEVALGLREVATIQPRYVAYAAAHGRTPEAMLEADARAYPGGRMTGFIVWCSEKWEDWCAVNRRKRNDIKSAEDHAAFDVFIGARKA